MVENLGAGLSRRIVVFPVKAIHHEVDHVAGLAHLVQVLVGEDILLVGLILAADRAAARVGGEQHHAAGQSLHTDHGDHQNAHTQAQNLPMLSLHEKHRQDQRRAHHQPDDQIQELEPDGGGGAAQAVSLQGGETEVQVASLDKEHDRQPGHHGVGHVKYPLFEGEKDAADQGDARHAEEGIPQKEIPCREGELVEIIEVDLQGAEHEQRQGGHQGQKDGGQKPLLQGIALIFFLFFLWDGGRRGHTLCGLLIFHITVHITSNKFLYL